MEKGVCDIRSHGCQNLFIRSRERPLIGASVPVLSSGRSDLSFAGTLQLLQANGVSGEARALRNPESEGSSECVGGGGGRD